MSTGGCIASGTTTTAESVPEESDAEVLVPQNLEAGNGTAPAGMQQYNREYKLIVC